MITKIHPRFPDYDVREDGRVFRARWTPRAGSGNYPRFGEIKGRVLASGYRQFKLCCADGSQVLIRANRLMAETFIGAAPSPAHQAAHKDGVRLNNVISNIRWATPKENSDDKIAHGTHPSVAPPNTKITLDQVDQIRAAFTGKRGEISKLSREFNLGRTTIYRVIRRQSALDKKMGVYA